MLCIGAIIMTVSIQPRLAVVLIATALVLLCAVLFTRADFEVERFDHVNERLYNTSVAAGTVNRV